MRLIQFRVQHFRSVEDSGWITCDDVTTLVGVNEVGKSNLLLALWKLNPAQGGEINLLADMPRRLYSTARNDPGDYTFIEADFELDDALAQAVADKALLSGSTGLQVRMARTFAGDLSFKLLNFTPASGITSTRLRTAVTDGVASTQESGSGDAATQAAQADAATLFAQLEEKLPTDTSGFTPTLLDEFRKLIGTSWSSRPDSVYKQAVLAVRQQVTQVERYFRHPHRVPGINELVMDAAPRFVYYSNYGNLDSEIYLPQAIENMQRRDLTGIAEAKARTLRVLFEYVGLNPQEIKDMGQEPVQPGYAATPEQVAQSAAKKTERQALLHSAQSKLSRDFREWWKQGEYTFDFRADGNYFRIFVADRVRPEQIELESRSTGLQWFLSFYLVFLVESRDAHQGTILLLDEAGHSLHPLAQRDLATFFANLSVTNQIVHTTQSPFLVDTNHVDRVKVVYVNDQGFTVASENLRVTEGRDAQQRSVYAVHAALGLSVSDTLLQGCLPVIVEGVSDQIYLNAIKNWLIGAKKINPNREVIFVPSGGTRGIKPLSSFLIAREGELPPVVVDHDQAGTSLKAQLLADLYASSPKKVMSVGEFSGVPDAEVEDLIPVDLLANALNRMFREVDEESFTDVYDPAKPLVDQVEGFARQHGVTLDPAWKVALAKGFKTRLQAKSPPAVDSTVSDAWKKLFTRILA